MRVGLVVPGFSADADDWCIPALRHLVAHLAGADEVRVLALRYPYRTGRYELFGAQVIALGGAQRRGWRSAALWQRGLGVLAAEHRRRRFDVLHAFWAGETGALAALAGRALGIPTIVSLAGGELVGLRDIGYGGRLVRTERFKNWLAARLADVVTAGSRYLLDLAAHWLAGHAHISAGGLQRRLLRLPLGVDTALFQPDPAAAASTAPRLIHVASLTPVKDQATLLRAMSLLQRDGQRCELEIAGTGPLEPDLRALAARLGMAAAVRFHGAVLHDRLPGFYRRGDLFVLSSRHEAQCMAALEAAACGLPVVGIAVGVVPELAPEAATATPPGDAAALAAAIADVLADTARRRAMGQAARTRAVEEFALARCVERTRQLYAALVQDHQVAQRRKPG